MKRIKGARPSPAMIVAGIALVAALAGTAFAGPLAQKSVLSKSEKKQVKSIAKKQVKALAPGLSVANAGTLDNIDSAGFLKVKSRVRQAVDAADGNYANDTSLVQINDLAAGEYLIQAKLDVDSDNAARVVLNCDIVAVATQLDTMEQTHDPDAASSDELGYALIGTFTASAAGTDDVFVRCTQDAGTDADGGNERIIATLLS